MYCLIDIFLKIMYNKFRRWARRFLSEFDTGYIIIGYIERQGKK